MSKPVALRDRAVGSLCNFLLNHFATKEYRAFVAACSTLGKEWLDGEVLGAHDPWRSMESRGPR